MRFLALALALVLSALLAAPGAAAAQQSWPILRTWAAGAEVDGEPAGPPPGTEAERVAQGQPLFGTYCARCHGNDAKGGGAAGQGLTPAPTDLTTGVIKFRSTPRETRPTELDLFRTVTRGLHGTAMPSFKDMPEAERWALAAFVRSLPEKMPAGSEVVAPAVPADLDSPARVARGAQSYRKLGCHSCHGETGKGDGPIAAALYEANGKPLRVRAFATEVPKRSRKPAELWLTIRTGIGRTPMPAFDASAPEELWDIVAWVRATLPRPGTVTGAPEKAGIDSLLVCSPPPPPAAVPAGGK